MKRRSFLSAIGLALIPLKGFGIAKWTPQIDSPSMSLVALKQGETFKLPLNPKKGERLDFQAHGDWQQSHPTIERNGHKIMGEASDLILDVNQSFSLEYQSPDLGWVFTQGPWSMT